MRDWLVEFRDRVKVLLLNELRYRGVKNSEGWVNALASEIAYAAQDCYFKYLRGTPIGVLFPPSKNSIQNAHSRLILNALLRHGVTTVEELQLIVRRCNGDARLLSRQFSYIGTKRAKIILETLERYNSSR